MLCHIKYTSRGFIGRTSCSLHSWADKVKFARTGGEANAIAVELHVHFLVNLKLQYVVTMDGMTGI